MRLLCVAVPKGVAEPVRRKLLEMDLLRRGFAGDREGDTVFFPVTKAPDLGHPVVMHDVREAHAPIRSYKDVTDVPRELRPFLPTSFDVVGDIAIIKIPEELTPFESGLGEAILRAHSHVKVVAADEGVKGVHRIRSLRVVAGPNRTETTHRELGLSYRVDVARAYFSPRLGTERLRVADQVAEGEVVVDVFSGVGPFAILIARRRSPSIVHAFDANPDAFRFLEENIRRNRAALVRPRLGDGVELSRAIEAPHRIILDYPQGPGEAYVDAVGRVAPGGMVHYYEILEAVEREAREAWLQATAKSAGRRADVELCREVHGWSPTRKSFVFDVRVS